MGKIKSSAFWWFMHHLQEQEYRNTGQKVPMGQINERAGEQWKRMSAQQRQPFIDKHERYKNGPRAPLTDFTPPTRQRNESRRVPIKEDPDAPSSRPDSRFSTSSANGNAIQDRRKQIIKALSKFIDEVGESKILTTRFYTIASNVMCATRKEIIVDGCVTEDVYYPLEIGIAEFTLKDGIIYEYNQFVDPGPVPAGMAHICNEHQKKHCIPLSDFSLSKGCCKDPLTQEYIPEERREDFDRVICDIHDIIVRSIIDEVQETPDEPVKLLFCQADQIYQNRGVLKTLGKEAGYDNFANDVEILDIADLFVFLSRRKNFKLKAALLDILECSKFNYDDRCEFHMSTETHYCAITVAKKYVWLMLEKLSELYQFSLTSKHKPLEKKKVKIQTSDDWVTWETELPPKSSTKRRYYSEDFDGPSRPAKAQFLVNWGETIGRGMTRNSDRDAHSVRPGPVVFASTDIRERVKQETTTEPTPGPSRTDFRPRLPGAEPVAPSPFKSLEPRVDNDSKPKISPASTPDTSRPLGRGRGRNTKANI